MANYSSIRHVRGIKGRAVALKNNQAFAVKLNESVRFLPKKVLGYYAATAINSAIDEKVTKHDSSRAAANWNLSFGNTIPPSVWDPKEYEQSFNASGETIGTRGAAGTFAETVKRVKSAYYGYVPEGKFQRPVPNGLIHTSLRIGKFAVAPVVYLYNPILSTGSSNYADNAWPGSSDFTSGQAIGISELASNLVPLLMQQLAQEVRWGHANKELK